MPPIVYYGSARQARLDAKETLPAKLDLILERLNLRERVKGETVAIKVHLGHTMSYSVIHPVFLRRVVQAVKDGGGRPFVTDLAWDTFSAAERGYSNETLGCPVYPAAGPDETYIYPHARPFKNIQNWNVAGMIQDASFLVNFAHIKGHPACGFGGAIKNLALGCMDQTTRSAIHDTFHFDPYWFPEKCPDPAVRQQILDACPHGGISQDRDNPENLHLHLDGCNACGRCLQVAPPGSLKVDAVNFNAFQEAVAISAGLVMSTFAPGKTVHLCLATHMTPVCDCFGFTGLPIVADAGVFGSDDIVALDQAALDVIGQGRLIEENVPASMEVHTREGHPFKWLHGPLKDPYTVTQYAEEIGYGTRQYQLVDVLPVEKIARAPLARISASGH